MHRSFFKSASPSRVDRKLAKDKADDAQWRLCCQLVDARDHRTCRCCGRRTSPDDVGLLRGHRHHIVYRSAGGLDESRNVVTLCATCHDAEHVKRTLDIDGNADTGLTFWKRDENDVWFIWRREVAVGLVEKD